MGTDPAALAVPERAAGGMARSSWRHCSPVSAKELTAQAMPAEILTLAVEPAKR